MDEMKTKTEYERTAFLPDMHCPYLDGPAFRCMLAFLRTFKPEHIFVIGDVVDFYQLSRFVKNPARMMELQADIDAANLALRQIRKAAPQAKIRLLKGNHEMRLQKFLWSAAAELVSLRDLTVPHLLGLKELNIEWVETGSTLFHGFLIKHGNLVRTRSGYTATGEREKAGISGVSGHTHRLSQVYNTNYNGMTTWVECGCLCRLDPEYAEGQVVDWQHGLAYGYFEKDNHRFVLHTEPIIKGSMVFNGKKISA